MMNITQNLVPKGRKNRPERANRLQYITIHNTGNTSKGATAQSHAKYIKGNTAANIPVSWHYTVDDREIIQHIPDSEIAWHAGDGGSGTGNNASIGIEICMNSDGDIKKATDLAVELTAYLCKKHSIKPENVVQHNHWSGKDCPQLLRRNKPYSFASFVGKVRETLGRTSPAPAPSAPTTSKAVKAGSAVTINKGAVYGGLSTARGKAVPSAHTGGKKHTVKSIATHKGVKEACLKEINSWVAVKSLTTL